MDGRTELERDIHRFLFDQTRKSPAQMEPCNIPGCNEPEYLHTGFCREHSDEIDQAREDWEEFRDQEDRYDAYQETELKENL